MIRKTAMPIEICAAAAGAAFGHEHNEDGKLGNGLRAAVRFAIAAAALAAIYASFMLL
jgi:hypothetical protein